MADAKSNTEIAARIRCKLVIIRSALDAIENAGQSDSVLESIGDAQTAVDCIAYECMRLTGQIEAFGNVKESP